MYIDYPGELCTMPMKPKAPWPPHDIKAEHITGPDIIKLMFNDGIHLKNLLDKLKELNIDPNEVFLSKEDNEDKWYNLYRKYNNPNYEQELIEYNQKLKEYEEQEIDYKSMSITQKQNKIKYLESVINSLTEEIKAEILK